MKLFVILFLGILALSCDAGTGAIPSGPNIKLLKDNLRFKNTDTKIMTNDSDDPSSVAKDAEVGSLYIKSDDGVLFQKQDSGSTTNWLPMLIGPSGSGTGDCVPRWDGTGVPLLQDSVLCVTDAGVVTGATQLDVDNLRLDGNTISSIDTNGNVILDPNGTGNINFPDLTAERPLYLDSSNNVTSPSWASLVNGTTNQITVTDNGADFTLSTPQNIATTSDVVFNSVDAASSVVGDTVQGTTSVDGGNLQLTGNTLQSTDANGNIILDPNGTGNIQFPDLTVSQPLYVDGSGNLVSQDISLTADVSGVLPPANGGTGVDGSSATNGQLLIGNGSGFTAATLTGTADQVNVTNGVGSVTLSTPQNIATTSDVEFESVTVGNISYEGDESIVGAKIHLQPSTGTNSVSLRPIANRLGFWRESVNLQILELSTTVSTTISPWNWTQNQASKTTPVLQLGDTDTGFNYEFQASNGGIGGIYLIGDGVQTAGFFEDQNYSYLPMEFQDNILMTGTGFLKLPVGTTAQRGTPTQGEIRYNSDILSFEGYDGSAWGSLGGGVGAPYIYEVTDFEGAVKAASFTCDSNLTAADDTSTPLNGNSSLTITQGATPPSVGAKCTGPSIAVPIGARNKVHVVYVPTINGMDSGDLAVNIYDVTNTVELAQASLNASTTKKYQPIYFKTASTTANIRIEFEVLVQSANAVAEFDDIYYQDRLDPVDVTNVISAVTAAGTAGNADAVGGKIDFTEVTDTAGAWDGNTYFVKNSGSEIKINGHVSYTATGVVRQIHLYKNGSLYKRINDNLINDESVYGFTYISASGEFAAGDTLSIRNAGSASGNRGTGTDNNWLNITETAKENFVAVKGTSVNDVANENGFSFYANDSGVVSREGLDWINGNGVVTDTSLFTYAIHNGVFSQTPKCFANVEESPANSASAKIESVSTTSVAVRISFASASTTYNKIAYAHTVKCERGDDYVKEQDRTTLIPVNDITRKIQTKIMASDKNTTGDISELTFNNLEVGKTYRVSGQVAATTIGSGVGIRFRNAASGAGNLLGKWYLYDDNGSNQNINVHGVSFTFTASTTSMYTNIYTAGTNRIILGDGTTDETFIQVEEIFDEGIFLGNFAQPTCYMKDVKSSGTQGGTFTSGSFQTRELNTTEGDCSWLSLSGNQFTLSSGAYNIECDAPAFEVQGHKAIIYDTTNTAIAILGSHGYAINSNNTFTHSFVKGRLSPTASTVYELQHRADVTKATNGFGPANGYAGVGEVYSQCKITKVR